jgi:hypothetical protein
MELAEFYEKLAFKLQTLVNHPAKKVYAIHNTAKVLNQESDNLCK